MTRLYHLLCFFLLLGNLHPLMAQQSPCQHFKNAVATSSLYYSAENKRSDTFDILKYTISLEIGNSVNKLIKGNTAIRFAPKMNNRSFIRLDLLKLTIDSVKEANTLLLYSYNDTVLKVNFSSLKNIADTSTITVYYQGQPKADLQWGGFYFDNNGGNEYAYNLGVGFKANPHNFGRVWFPCFDNFVERSKYEFFITSDSARRAYCNGSLISDVVTAGNRTRRWVLNEEIPSYLASVAVARYRQVNWTASTFTGPKPVLLAAVAADTTPLKTGFANLLNCIAGFENKYGDYRWNRFGYVLVPFNAGAMEHATNIAYPRSLISPVYEAVLMAHELSHHWWGDLITCETQEDMWINEGLATYSQYIFTEWQYGYAPYINSVKAEHEKLLHFVHKSEGGFRAVSGVPHSLTYGDHVYKKGADVAHNLRTYMGDTAFFDAVKYTMQQAKFKSVNSLQLRDYFQTSSGQNLTSFFNNWVFNGGWTHFSIDSVKYVPAGGNSFNAIVSLKQKLYGAPALFSNVPVELSFFKNDWSRIRKTVVMSGSVATFTVNVPYQAVYCALNYDHKLGDATGFESKVIKSVANIAWNYGKLLTMVQNPGADSSLVRVIHNYVKPDPFKSNPQGHKLSDQHYWKVEGILSPGFHSRARFNFDGNKVNGGTFSYLDTLLTIVSNDSIRVFYRANAADDWKMQQSAFVFLNGLKAGFIEIDTLKLGEYTFGNYGDTTVSLNKHLLTKINGQIYPNPAQGSFRIRLADVPAHGYQVNVTDLEGRLIQHYALREKNAQLDISSLAKGTYLVSIEEKGKLLYCEKLLVE